MSKIFALLLSTLILAGVVTPKAHAAGLPVVESATVDYTQMTLTITGQNFGSKPVPSCEPADLACGEAEPLGSPDELQIAVDHSLNALQSV